jgi:hypothetical protein
MDRSNPEVKDLKQEIAKLIIERFGGYKEHGHTATSYATVHFHEKEPYMCVVVSYHGHYGRAVGVGFSSPYVWDVEHAYAQALEEAAEHAASQLA